MSSSEDIELKCNCGNTITIDSRNQNYCGCCEGIRRATPAKTENLPGLSTLSYRVGTYSQFKESMLVSLSSRPELARLTTRDESNDLAIACLDSCAVMLDILTFYQERIANEGFLRTATKRRSILELARSIGYELRPGVAANTFLAFTLDDTLTGGMAKPNTIASTTSTTTSIIDAGTKVQSMPGSSKIPVPQVLEKVAIEKIQSQLPLIFETTEKIEARSEWNNLKPKLTVKQIVDKFSNVIYFKGVSTQLRSGDFILIVKNESDDPGKAQKFVRTVSKVTAEPENQRTVVDLLGAVPIQIGQSAVNIGGVGENSAFHNVSEVFSFSKPYINLTELDDKQKAILTSSKWSAAEYTTMATKTGLSNQEFLGVLNKWAGVASSEARQTTWVYTFRVKAGVFGNNSPSYDILPDNIKNAYQNWDSPALPINKKRQVNSELSKFQITSSPSAISREGKIHIFYRVKDNSLLHLILNGNSWSKYEFLDGKVSSDPAAVVWPDGQIYVFVRWEDMRLAYKRFDGNTWSGWQRSLGGIFTSAPAVTYSSADDGKMYVFAKSQSDTIWVQNI